MLEYIFFFIYMIQIIYCNYKKKTFYVAMTLVQKVVLIEFYKYNNYSNKFILIEYILWKM